MKKLSLSVRESTIATAKRLAEESGTSVSAMFERVILRLESQKNVRNANVGPRTNQATGLIELTGDADGSDVLAEALLDKYWPKP